MWKPFSCLLAIIVCFASVSFADDLYTFDYLPEEYRRAEAMFASDLSTEALFAAWQPKCAMVSWDQKVGHTGPGSAKISPHKEDLYLHVPSVPVTAGHFVAAWCWVKLDKAGPVRPRLVFHDKQGKSLGESDGGTPYGLARYLTFPLDGTHDWSLLCLRAQAPAGSHDAQFVLCANATGGTAWMDDVRIVQLGKETVQGDLDRKPVKLDVRDISPEKYVRIKDGHFSVDGKRLRLWSSQGNLMGWTHRDIDLEVARYKQHGFNGHRTPSWWAGPPANYDYTPGDLSEGDRRDYLMAKLGQAGIRVWYDGLNNWPCTAADVGVIDDPATAEAWKKAVKQFGDCKVNWRIAAEWDPRMQQIYRNYIKKVLNHRNLHNGLRYADDPAFYTWELSNEEWWYQRILWGNHLELPKFFQKSFNKKWNQWLAKRYGSTGDLKKAWEKLRPGEDLEKQTVLFLTAGVNEEVYKLAQALGLQIQRNDAAAAGQELGVERGRDVMRFLTDMNVDYKRDLEKTFRAQGLPDKGCSVVPLVWDTQFSELAFSQYVLSHSALTTNGFYLDMTKHNPATPTFPFDSALREPPTINGCVESRCVKDKPAVVYEHMIFCPEKYRAEYAYRVLALTAIQDFDVVDFHYYGHPNFFPTQRNPYTNARLQYMLGAEDTYGLSMREDEVLMSTIKLAGEIFKGGYLKPAPNPVVVTLGKQSIFNIHDLNYQQHYEAADRTAFSQGFRWDFDPNRDADSIAGKLTDAEWFKRTSPIQPTEQIQYRWKEGTLVLDAPCCKALIGFAPEQFAYPDGTALTGITVNTPPAMPCAIKGERYVAIGIVSEDRQPLDRSQRITISAVNTAFNSGFAIDLKKMAKDKDYAHGLGRSITNVGDLPVLVGRVGVTIKANWLKGKQYRMIDYDNNCLLSGRCAEGVLTIPNDQKVYLVEITP
jgi:hypothetical protein